ncbi:MAG TPA: type II secretion system F family protein [Phycisphaerae bacterium]|nr:type II secretion system F family protein [Phycisphaerae bacterium]
MKATVMNVLVVGILVFVAIVALGGSVLSVFRGRRQIMQSRLASRSGARKPRPAKTGPRAVAEGLDRLGRLISPGRPSVKLRKELAQAGFHGASAPEAYLGIKTLCLTAGLVGLAAATVPLAMPLPAKALAVLLGAGLLFLLPNMIVSARRGRRRADVRRHLPEAVDLLEVCVSSGMAMDTSWNLVAEEVRRVSTVLADEMALTNLEIHLGSPRMEAMRNLATRTGVQEISSLVAVLVQSERFGTSIADALRSFASSMREGRGMRASEEAERMAVRMLFPMVLFIFPALLIVLVGPAGMTLAKMLSSQ